MTDTAEAANLIWQAAGQGQFYPEALHQQLSLEEGYAVQTALRAKHVAAGARQVGWKIGFTSANVREMFKAAEPVFGYLLDANQMPSGHRFEFSTLIKPAIESELYFTLARDLPGAGVTAGQVLEAVGGITPAFEIIEFRGEMAAELPLGVADNVSHRAFVLGDAKTPFPRELDLATLRAKTTCNGEVVSDVRASEVIDNQLESIAWLAKALAARGLELQAGQGILSGSFGRPPMIGAGDTWLTEFSGVGSVSAHFA